MDTGLLDTDRYLGINAAPANRLLIRNIVTCSPIRIHDYVEIATTNDANFPLWEIYLGPVPGISNIHTATRLIPRSDVVRYQTT
jgi:hypothetical protein